MAFIQFSQVSLAFGDRDILKNVSVNLQTGTKAALTGANGAGKSTLIKVMAGLVEPDSGTRTAQKGIRISYLPQSGLTHHGCTLKEEADKAFSFGYEIQEEIEKIGEQLKSGEGNTKVLLERHDELLTFLETTGWNRREAKAESVLIGLGFERSDLERKTEEFSGGWQMRIALAKALMTEPDILLLDEPTNYLDLEARNWLEKFLNDFKGGFLLVSHDRYFLDSTINEVYELFGGDLKRYSGNFSHYEKVREVELQTLMAEYEKQQQEISKLEDFIRRFGYKATKAAQAQERQKMLDKLLENKIEIPESLKKIHFKFPAAPHSGRLVLTLENVTKTYDGKKNVIDDLSLVVENGEHLVVAGRNGAGKSTLLRVIAGVDSDFSGTVKLGAGVTIGYFSQDNAELIKGSQTVLDFVEEAAPTELVPKVRDMLGAFLFRGDDVFKTIDVLSGGEKSRIALLKLLLHPVNLLILDEPTNHLDMHSKDVLLSALKDFGGTVIFVSHDRGFIEDLSDKVLELKSGDLSARGMESTVGGGASAGSATHGIHRLFVGGYKYYIERIEAEESDTELSTSATRSFQRALEVTVNEKSTASEPTQSQKNLSWEEQKRLQSEKRKLEKEVSQLEEKIATLETEKTNLQNEMGKSEVYTDGQKCKEIQTRIAEIDAELDDLNARWEEAAGKL